MSGEAFTITVLATCQFSVQIVQVYSKGILSHAGQSQQEISPAQSRNLGGDLLRYFATFVPGHGCGEAQLTLPGIGQVPVSDVVSVG